MLPTRKDILHNAKKIVIKAGTSTVTTPEGLPSLPRMAGIVENVVYSRLSSCNFLLLLCIDC